LSESGEERRRGKGGEEEVKKEVRKEIKKRVKKRGKENIQ
jgi:hypothetical protein